MLLGPSLDPSWRYARRLEQSAFEYNCAPSQKATGFRLPVPTDVQAAQAWAVDERLAAGGCRLIFRQASLHKGWWKDWYSG